MRVFYYLDVNAYLLFTYLFILILIHKMQDKTIVRRMSEGGS